MCFFSLALAGIIPYFPLKRYYRLAPILASCDNSSWYALPVTYEWNKERKGLCYEKCYAIRCHYRDWYYRTCRGCVVPGAGSWRSSRARYCRHRGRYHPDHYWCRRYDGHAQQKPPVVAVKNDAYCALKQIEHTLTLPLPPVILTCEHINICRLKEGASL